MSFFKDVGRTLSGKGKGNPIGAIRGAVEGGVREVRHVADVGVNQIQSETKHGLQQIKNELPNIPKEIEEGVGKGTSGICQSLGRTPTQTVCFIA